MAACASPKGIEGAPARELPSELVRVAGDRITDARPCLYVTNRTDETACLFIEGEHFGWIGPNSSAAYFVGRSASPSTALHATSPAGEWRVTSDGPPWMFHWRLLGPGR